MIIMKFGGTSVGDATAIRQVVLAVIGGRAESPVVVVSALSKVTDTLLALEAMATAGEAAGMPS